MKFISTRGGEPVSAGFAISAGIAEGGGLYVPEVIPKISSAELELMLELNYAERAAFILKKFLDGYDSEKLKEACLAAYSKFYGGDAAPLVKIDDKLFILELFHGPTSAFKDMALTLLPHLLREGSNLSGIKQKILILTATSGDTGKAALEGFKDAEGIDILVFYPSDGVSKMQKLQMQSQQGKNVGVIAVEGNFDDCQNAVKEIFTNAEYKNKLKEMGIVLSSANSINFGRLAPQLVYYFSAYLDLVNSGEIQNGEKISFSVPTGNFGNILAAYYAKQMGLPIAKLICASNRNNVLADFFKNGKYDADRTFYKTMSPSMDILISSNLERLIFETSNRNAKLTAQRMSQLLEEKEYSVSEEELEKLSELFYADFCDEDMTVEAIYEFFEEYAYPLDTHTAVAVSVGLDYAAKTKAEEPLIVVSTASPYKFPQDVLYSLTGNDVSNCFKAVKRIHALTAMPIPESLAGLKDAEILFDKTIKKQDIFEEVLKFANEKN